MGFETLRAGEGGATAWVVRTRTRGGAAEAVNEAYRALARSFGGPLAKGFSVQDVSGRAAHSAFRARAGGRDVSGLVLASVANGQATVAVIFDDAERAERTLPLLARDVERAVAPEGSAPQAPRLSLQSIPDGSGQVGVPEGWQITGGQNGAVDVVGPNQEWIALGAVYPFNEPSPYVPQGFGFTPPYAPPAVALSRVLPEAYAQVLGGRHLGPVRIHEEMLAAFAGGESSWILFDATWYGVPYRFLAYVITMRSHAGIWTLSVSWVGAPVDAFAPALPTMLASWQSWRVSGRVLMERLEDAARSMRETSRILTESSRHRSEVFANASHDFSLYLRGEEPIRDTRDDEQHWVGTGWARGSVDALNRAAGYERWIVDDTRPYPGTGG
jgi:hypothetical protein